MYSCDFNRQGLVQDVRLSLSQAIQSRENASVPSFPNRSATRFQLQTEA
ncbi:MAG: hypothetical protein KME59_13255 [Trichormus sp. ATA11-4-KO1]|nr:hypothetical protein [Trichormus sp. ATA11-4-KO1]